MKKVRCPNCKEWSEWEGNPHRPFCSEQCRQIDLGNWATERYRVPVQEEETPEGAGKTPDEEEKKK